MRYKESFHREPAGRCPDTHTEPPPHPNTYLHLSASCLRYLTRVFLPRLRAHPSQAEQPAVRSLPHSRTLPRITGRREREVGERPVCSVATSGCPTRSEDGFPAGARNIPPRPAQPNSKQKASYREVGGVRRAADGNRTRVSGLGSVRSTIELQPHPFQCIALACRG